MARVIPLRDLSVEYDQLFDAADQLIRARNPCGIRVEDGVVSCNKARLNPRWAAEVGPQLCCSGCPHWQNGCTVRSLGCKLGTCTSFTNYDEAGWPEDVAMEMRGLMKSAQKRGLQLWRSMRQSKEEYFEQA